MMFVFYELYARESTGENLPSVMDHYSHLTRRLMTRGAIRLAFSGALSPAMAVGPEVAGLSRKRDRMSIRERRRLSVKTTMVRRRELR